MKTSLQLDRQEDESCSPVPLGKLNSMRLNVEGERTMNKEGDEFSEKLCDIDLQKIAVLMQMVLNSGEPGRVGVRSKAGVPRQGGVHQLQGVLYIKAMVLHGDNQVLNMKVIACSVLFLPQV